MSVQCPHTPLSISQQQAHVADAAEEDVQDAAEAALVHAAQEGALHDEAQEVGPGRLRLGQGDLHRQRRGGDVKSGEESAM